MPAALPRTMSQLKALKGLYVGKNKLPSADVDFIIDSFPQLTTLAIDDLGLTGEQLHVLVVPELVLLTLVCAALPSTIGNMQALTNLYAHGNQFRGEHLLVK